MNERPIAWVDASCCTGCGACVDVCPAGATTVLDVTARVDEERCTGCGACVDVCPEGAIQLVPTALGELVPAAVGQRPLPAVHRSSPLINPAGTVIAAAGASLLIKALRALVQEIGRWLMHRPRPARGSASSSLMSSHTSIPGRTNAGCRTRRRQRGGR